jgi:hypothetical protein
MKIPYEREETIVDIVRMEEFKSYLIALLAHFHQRFPGPE